MPPSRGTAAPRCGVGMLAAARGDVDAAARWYRQAAEAGSRNGAFNLGLLLAREGSEPEAALWWARAADAGHGRAALRLALLAVRRGELAEGRKWCTQAVELGPAEVVGAGRQVVRGAATGTERVRNLRWSTSST